MDDLTTAAFQELFELPAERTRASEDLPEVTIEGEFPAGTAATRVTHEAIISMGFSKVMGPSDKKIDYSKLRSDGSIEYRSLTWDEEKRITPDSITEPTIEDPFPPKVVEGTPLGMD